MTSLRRRRVSILAISFLIAAFARDALDAQQPFHALVFTTGATTMKVDALNSTLASGHYAGLSNDGISYGASAHYAFGRAMLGADFSKTTFGEEGLSNGRSNDLNAMQVLGTVSFAIMTTPRLTLFPTLGVGTGKFDVTLRDRNKSAQPAATTERTFAELVADAGASTTVSGNHLMYSVGGGLDFLVTRGASSGVVLGLRAGMLVAPNRTTWSSGGTHVVAGPDASAGGPFARLVVGIGGR